MGIDEYLLQNVEKPADEAWEVNSPDRAEYATRMIAKARAAIEARTEQADARIAMIKQWQADESKEDERTIAFFTARLEPWVREQIAGGKKKSKTLINGAKVAFKAAPLSYNYDNDVILAWAEAIGDFFKTEKKLAWGELKKRLTIVEAMDDDGNPIKRAVYEGTGEMLPITVTENPDSFSVDTKAVKL